MYAANGRRICILKKFSHASKQGVWVIHVVTDFGNRCVNYSPSSSTINTVVIALAP